MPGLRPPRYCRDGLRSIAVPLLVVLLVTVAPVGAVGIDAYTGVEGPDGGSVVPDLVPGDHDGGSQSGLLDPDEEEEGDDEGDEAEDEEADGDEDEEEGDEEDEGGDDEDDEDDEEDEGGEDEDDGEGDEDPEERDENDDADESQGAGDARNAQANGGGDRSDDGSTRGGPPDWVTDLVPGSPGGPPDDSAGEGEQERSGERDGGEPSDGGGQGSSAEGSGSDERSDDDPAATDGGDPAEGSTDEDGTRAEPSGEPSEEDDDSDSGPAASGSSDGDDDDESEGDQSSDAVDDADGTSTTTGQIDVPSPPRVHVQAVTTNRSVVAEGEPVEITARLENAGDLEGVSRVRLRLFGEVVDVRQVEVPANGARRVSFVREIEAPGTYEAVVGEASTHVTVTPADGGSTPEEPVSQEAPGFTAVAALVAVLVAAGVARRRA